MKRISHESLTLGIKQRFEVLTQDESEQIHEAGLEILSERGMWFGSKEARQILCDHGCYEDDEQCIHFPKNLVEDCIRKAPASFVHYGRSEEDDVHIVKGQVYGCNSGQEVYFYDLDTRERRHCTKKDAIDIIHTIDALKNVHIYNRCMVISDVPEQSDALHNAEIAFVHTAKPKQLVVNTPFQAKKVVEMAKVLCGSEENMRRRPPCVINNTTISPLRLGEHTCDNAIIAARANLPCNLLFMTQAGATTPQDIAGSLVVKNTEFLAFNTLIQCVNPGNTALYASTSCIMNMRNGNSLMAAPESILLNMSAAHMAHFYEVPSYITAGKSDAMEFDIQNGAERGMSRLMSALCGANIICGAGTLQTSMAFDIASLLLDDELIDATLRIIAGYRVNAKTISTDLIKQTGPFGEYITSEDTLNKVHQVSRYDLMNLSNYDSWQAAGSPSVIDNACTKAKNLLATHKQANPLSEQIVKDIRSIVVDAEEELGVSDFWKEKQHRFHDCYLTQ